MPVISSKYYLILEVLNTAIYMKYFLKKLFVLQVLFPQNNLAKWYFKYFCRTLISGDFEIQNHIFEK